MNINKSILLVVLYSLMPLGVSEAYSQDARLQLAIATPDPVTAGASVSFQIIYVNTSAREWTEGDYSVNVELFNSNEEFLKRTSAQTIRETVPAGRSTLLLISENIPEDFWGQHLYRVNLVSRGRTVHTSEMRPFHITASAPREDPEEVPYDPVAEMRAFRGNAILSGRFDTQRDKETSKENKTYRASLSLNGIGSFNFGAVSFNASLYNTEEEFLDIYTLYLNISGRRSSLEIGDSMPFFSELSLRGQSGRGINYTFRPGPYRVQAAFLQTSQSEDTDSSFGGNYSRYLIGGSVSSELFRNLTLGLSAVTSFDDINSISTAAAAGTPAEWSSVFSLRADYRPGDFSFGLETGLNFLSSKSNEFDTETSTTSAAVRASAAYVRDRAHISGLFYLTGPSFVSLGAPGVINDRIGYEADFRYRLTDWLSAGYLRMAHHDNIENRPSDEKSRTLQNTDSLFLQTFSPGKPSIHLSGSLNRVESDPKGSIDNESITGALSMSHSMGAHFLSGGFSYSGFADNTTDESNLSTISGNLNYSASLSQRLSLNSGCNYSITTEDSSSGDLQTLTLSAGGTLRIIPGRFSATLSGYITDRSGEVSANKADSTEIRVTAETTWRIQDNYSITLGGSFRDYKDRIDNDKEYKGWDILIRGLYSF